MLDPAIGGRKMSNKKDGSAFEREFAEKLSANGYWVHLLRDNHNGQPFDLIAVRDGIAYAIDCKDCTSEKFPLSRIEENQRMAMELWTECGNNTPMFAIKLPFRGIRLLKYSDAMHLDGIGVKTLRGNDIAIYTYPLKVLL